MRDFLGGHAALLGARSRSRGRLSTVTQSPASVDSTTTASMRTPYWLTNERCVITPTPTGTKSNERCESKKPAQLETGSRMAGQRGAGSNRSMPITGPGKLKARPRASSSPMD